MKILYITTIGATMVFFKEFIAELVQLGHTVDIAANETDSPVPGVYRDLGCKIYPITCERSLDKMEMYSWLATNGYSCAKSYVDKEEFYHDLETGKISFPVFVKPVRGSASIAISKVFDREAINLLFAHNVNLMIQEFLDGQEIGADVYIDMISGEAVSLFTQKTCYARRRNG